jgi:uncharacterized protein
MSPLLTQKLNTALRAAARQGLTEIECSLDLERSTTLVELDDAGWIWQQQRFPFMEICKARTIYHWAVTEFQPVARFTTALFKLVPTDSGPPTFEIDGIKMLPTAQGSPFADAERKVSLIQPRGKVVLDTCGGLGYFSHWCLQGQARQVLSYEKSADVLWLRSLNPWSPVADPGLTLTEGDITQHITSLANEAVDAVLHDPPRFGIAGELYAQDFYQQLARVLKRKGKLFHYTGTPNALTSGRDVPNEVAQRLRRAGFCTEFNGDGILASRG